MNVPITNLIDKLRIILNVEFASIAMVIGVLLSTWLLGQSVIKLKETSALIKNAEMNEAVEERSFTIGKQDLTSDKIDEIARVVALVHPTISITSARGKIILSSKSMENYERWYLALLATQNYGGIKLEWDTPLICIGKCREAADAALYAELQPHTRTIKSSSK